VREREREGGGGERERERERSEKEKEGGREGGREGERTRERERREDTGSGEAREHTWVHARHTLGQPHIYIYIQSGEARQHTRNTTYDTCRPTIIAESQPALKFRVNRPRPRSQPARAGRACVLVVYFFSRQLGQCVRTVVINVFFKD
jgi:hypothetical protein